MKKSIILKRRLLKNIFIILTILFIALALISSSSISVINCNEKKFIDSNLKEKNQNENLLTNLNNPTSSLEKSTRNIHTPILEDCPVMYGYCAYNPGGNEGIVMIYTCNCTVVYLGEGISGDFLAGGTFGCDGVWYATQYGNGLLYGIDPYSGDMWSIGGGGVGINGLAYDPITHRMFGVDSSDTIYKIDTVTGEQEMMGNLEYSGGYMIGMAFDADGQLYGWDLITDSLWKIDPDDTSAEMVGALGINMNYAGDGDFHRESDTLYILCYSSMSGLYTVDKTTGQATLICNLGGIDITSAIFLNSCTIPEHDVSIRSIDYPESGYAIENVPMQVTVKNYGNNTETTDIEMKVINYEEGVTIYEEDFSGSFPPEGWETDFWNKSDTNIAGGISPEAKVNKYDQYNEGQNYDNYISSAKINCSDYDKIKLRFKWAADYGIYAKYASVYVKIRSDSSSPWKDVTPWENPVGENQPARVVDINCYSIYEQLGDEFEVKWEYVGYYYYYNNLWLDDFEIITYNSYEDYNETVEDIEVEKGEEIIVEFPEWTPTNWQDPDYEDIWVDYKINARTLLEDDRPGNDYKNKIVELYYPWVHDVELKCINSPCENGPGKTYPVDVTIKNVGQNDECCMPVYVSIGESFIMDSLLEEDAWDNIPPDGWYDEHKEIGSEYGWNKSDTTKSGGESPEAYLPYQYARKDYVMYSYSINTIDFPMVRLKFKTYIDHYSGQGLYSLEAGYSTDKETWHTVWHEEPGSNKNYDVDVPINESSETLYIGFWVKGDPYYFNKWYIDDIKLQSMGYEEEYSDYACQGPDIEPGEEVTLSFDDWMPEFLLEETTGTKEYIIGAKIELEGDKNPSNDIKNEIFILEFFYDVGIDEIISPAGGHPDRIEGDLIYDNGEPDGFDGLFFGYYGGYDNWLIDDFEITQKTDITGIKFHFVWNDGYSSNCENVKICIVEETGTCNPDSGPAYYETETTDFVEYATGNVYFSRPEVVIEADFEGITIPAGKYWIGVCPEGLIDNSAYWLTAPLKNCCIQFDSPYLGYPRWLPGSNVGCNYDLAWAIYGRGWAPPIKAWIQPGSEDIKSVVKNYGTFDYEDLTCYAQISEFITDPENGTELWEGEIANIDLLPLGGSKNLDFGEFTFADEGRYGLFMQLPADPDDVQKNNEMRWGIGVDDTEPFCDPPIFNPPNPDGNNGWYVNPVTITINANDPFSNDVSSGVKEIRYSIGGGPIVVIEGNTVTFIVTDEGDDIPIEYWAIDWVGNIESPKNMLTLDIDLTKPNISLHHEVAGGNKWQGWDFEFYANAYDMISDIDYVEFYFNDELQETILFPGPYVWNYTYYGGLDMIITAIAYDNAGHYNSDEIENPTKNLFDNPHTNKILDRSHNLVKTPCFR